VIALRRSYAFDSIAGLLGDGELFSQLLRLSDAALARRRNRLETAA